jgi:hypothetical protein
VKIRQTVSFIASWWRGGENWNDVHQEEFARSLKDDIAVILKEFGQMKGYDIPDQYYSDLAWGGLTETSIFDELVVQTKQGLKMYSL